MNVYFYYFPSEPRKVKKTLENELMLNSVNLKEPCDLLNPTIIVSNAEVLNRNYFYIPKFNRYYFINGVTLLNGGLIEINGHVDVLMTYSEKLLNKKAFVLRQENEFNEEFNDSLLPIRADTNYKSYSFGDVIDEYNFYITTNGGVH